MANNPSAKKRHRQSLIRRARNRNVLTGVRRIVRRARAAVESGDPEASGLVHQAERMLRKAGGKGMLPAGKVDRTVSRLRRATQRPS